MAVRFKLSETFRTQVNFYALDEKGKKEHFNCTLEFRRLKTSVAKELLDKVRSSPTSDKDFLSEVLTNWVMVSAETGDPVPFTPENFDTALEEVGGLAALMVNAFFEAAGVAREKN